MSLYEWDVCFDIIFVQLQSGLFLFNVKKEKNSENVGENLSVLPWTRGPIYTSCFLIDFCQCTRRYGFFNFKKKIELF